MQLQRSYGQQYTGPEQFDFIMNPGNKVGRRFPGSPSTGRLVIVLVGTLILIALAWIILSIVRSGPHADNKQLLTILQLQTELVRVSQESISLADQQQTRNFAQTTQLDLLTQQSLFRSYITNHGLKISKTQLRAHFNATTDAQLKTANINGNVDSVYKTYAIAQLADYERQLQQTYKIAQLRSEKNLLQNAFNEAQLLVELGKQQ